MKGGAWRSAQGLTLVELAIVVAVVAILVALAGPSLRDMLTMQRLRGTSAQFVTDMQYARSEAVSRGRPVRVNITLTAADQTCYTLYVAAGNGIRRCDCALGAGSACSHPDSAGSQEVRTVSVPHSTLVRLAIPQGQDTAFGYDHVTGGLISIPTDMGSSPLQSVQVDVRVDDDRRLRTTILQTGRPSVCAPNATVMQVPSC